MRPSRRAVFASGMVMQAGIPEKRDSPPVARRERQTPRKVDGQKASWYWSGTEYSANPNNAWNFNMNNGNQNINNKNNNGYGLAVRSG